MLRGVLESYFGFSLANLGDINHDGYSDLAVGAPYEGDGAIYIYLGSKDGIVEQYSQVNENNTFLVLFTVSLFIENSSWMGWY